MSTEGYPILVQFSRELLNAILNVYLPHHLSQRVLMFHFELIPPGNIVLDAPDPRRPEGDVPLTPDDELIGLEIDIKQSATGQPDQTGMYTVFLHVKTKVDPKTKQQFFHIDLDHVDRNRHRRLATLSPEFLEKLLKAPGVLPDMKWELPENVKVVPRIRHGKKSGGILLFISEAGIEKEFNLRPKSNPKTGALTPLAPTMNAPRSRWSMGQHPEHLAVRINPSFARSFVAKQLERQGPYAIRLDKNDPPELFAIDAEIKKMQFSTIDVDIDVRGGWPKDFDAALYYPRNKKAYFFSGSQYWRFDLKLNRFDTGYPRAINRNWSGFPGDFASKLDAAMAWSDDKVLFFKGDRVLEFDARKEKAIGQPKKLSDYFANWPGWGHIDAAFFAADVKSHFLFKGHQFVQVDMNRKVVKGPEDVNGSRTLVGWPKSFSDTIRCALQGGDDVAWLFFDRQYLPINLGRKSFRQLKDIGGNWRNWPTRGNRTVGVKGRLGIGNRLTLGKAPKLELTVNGSGLTYHGLAGFDPGLMFLYILLGPLGFGIPILDGVLSGIIQGIIPQHLQAMLNRQLGTEVSELIKAVPATFKTVEKTDQLIHRRELNLGLHQVRLLPYAVGLECGFWTKLEMDEEILMPHTSPENKKPAPEILTVKPPTILLADSAGFVGGHSVFVGPATLADNVQLVAPVDFIGLADDTIPEDRVGIIPTACFMVSGRRLDGVRAAHLEFNHRVFPLTISLKTRSEMKCSWKLSDAPIANFDLVLSTDNGMVRMENAIQTKRQEVLNELNPVRVYTRNGVDDIVEFANGYRSHISEVYRLAQIPLPHSCAPEVIAITESINTHDEYVQSTKSYLGQQEISPSSETPFGITSKGNVLPLDDETCLRLVVDHPSRPRLVNITIENKTAFVSDFVERVEITSEKREEEGDREFTGSDPEFEANLKDSAHSI